jgi:nicotinamidase-related amidase
MPVTQLDPVAALVAIDLQKGILAIPKAHPIEHILERTAALAQAFRKRGLPVVLVNVTGAAPGRTDAGRRNHALPPGWDELAPELDAQSGDLLISKQRWGAFIGTALDAELRARGVTQIVLAGVATSIGVESTARSAHELGYNVVLAVDAMTDLEAEAHRFTVEKIFPRLGEVDTTENVLKMLAEQPTALPAQAE